MIHCYKLLGLNIVLDISSGSVHAVDEVAYDIIEMYESTPKDEIKKIILEKYRDRTDVTESDVEDCFADIEELKNAGKLFVPDTFAPMAGDLKKKTAGVLKALCLHVAHTCN